MNPSESVSLCVRGCTSLVSLFFFNDTATTEIYTLSLHDALPIYQAGRALGYVQPDRRLPAAAAAVRAAVAVDGWAVHRGCPALAGAVRPGARGAVGHGGRAADLCHLVVGAAAVADVWRAAAPVRADAAAHPPCCSADRRYRSFGTGGPCA